jgi:hypothetical protein
MARRTPAAPTSVPAKRRRRATARSSRRGSRWLAERALDGRRGRDPVRCARALFRWIRAMEDGDGRAARRPSPEPTCSRRPVRHYASRSTPWTRAGASSERASPPRCHESSEDRSAVVGLLLAWAAAPLFSAAANSVPPRRRAWSWRRRLRRSRLRESGSSPGCAPLLGPRREPAGEPQGCERSLPITIRRDRGVHRTGAQGNAQITLTVSAAGIERRFRSASIPGGSTRGRNSRTHGSPDTRTEGG